MKNVKKSILILFAFAAFLISACDSNKQDYYLSAYQNQDYTTAFAFAHNACDDEKGEACYILANIYYMGLSHQIDYVKATRYYIKSCEMGNGRACYMAGKLYSGNNVIKNPEQSKSYYKISNTMLIKECKSGNGESCFYLADLYLQGKGVPADINKAYDYINKACRFGYKEACK